MQPALPSTPEAPTSFTPEHTYEYPYPPVPEVFHSYGPTLGPYTYLPPELDYALPTLAARYTWLDEVVMNEYGTSCMPFGHPALVQTVITLLWGDKQYQQYLDVERKNLTPIIIFAGTILYQVLDEYSNGIFLPQDFSTRTNGLLHRKLHSHMTTLQDIELEPYNKLLEDIHAQGAEMLGAC
ncbi:hypothetical protein BKA82DRAFT_17488 [Pisolithus tinctorius]|uniref:DUF6532 domain-containing protein n=1 Tax=Pisolithus tinctorius Marx 270 TaxID=870435 RepID=A0A0C3KYK1_PISTI|nr:hypothetical protein BKA82DRAFT_17488 [Pisolithus tinctorius]KIO14607.1 hypothetical protein M404DRAFT_17488 [Pisolithus tinctorius Marx 270]